MQKTFETDFSSTMNRSVETDDYIKSIILHALEAKGIAGHSARYVADVVEIVKSHLITRKWIERSPKESLPFKNGVLEVATLKFLPHSPGYKFTWSLPREYNALATDWSLIDNWLSQATGSDESVKRILLCYLNSLIKGRSDLEYFLYLTGEGGTGKSTFIRLCASLVGEYNTYSSSLREWENSRFETANAYRKRLLVFPDEPKQPGGIDNLKKATGNDFFKAEEKGKKSFNYVFDGMLIIASNFPIFVSETSSALKRRMISVPFNNMVPAFMKRNMNKEFEAYLDALINYVLTIPDDEVTKTLGQIGTTSPAVIQQYWEDRKRNDSILAWADISLVPDPTNRERTGNDKGDETALYGNYYQCCLRMGMTPKSVNNFVADLKSLLVHTLKWENVKPVKNELFRGLSGVRFRSDRIDSNTPYPIESLCHAQQVDAIEKTYGNTTDVADRPGLSSDGRADIAKPLPDKGSDIPDRLNETSKGCNAKKWGQVA